MQASLLRGAIAALTIVWAGAVSAQEESTNRVDANTDWSVFEEADPKQCWAVSSPKETVNTRDGRVVAVRRGDILLFVSYLPSEEVAGQVSFTGGYPFQEGSTVSLEISGRTFDLFTSGEMAWARDTAADAEIIEAMKQGADAILTGVSSRGTSTKDTFSLFGFTASVEEAAARCAG
jgi:hypothetical protein